MRVFVLFLSFPLSRVRSLSLYLAEFAIKKFANTIL